MYFVHEPALLILIGTSQESKVDNLLAVSQVRVTSGRFMNNTTDRWVVRVTVVL